LAVLQTLLGVQLFCGDNEELIALFYFLIVLFQIIFYNSTSYNGNYFSVLGLGADNASGRGRDWQPYKIKTNKN
jgi:hypothetical protein